jgi:hypothetical protein
MRRARIISRPGRSELLHVHSCCCCMCTRDAAALTIQISMLLPLQISMLQREFESSSKLPHFRLICIFCTLSHVLLYSIPFLPLQDHLQQVYASSPRSGPMKAPDCTRGFARAWGKITVTTETAQKIRQLFHALDKDKRGHLTPNDFVASGRSCDVQLVCSAGVCGSLWCVQLVV